MRARRLLIVIGFAAALTGAGCGGDDDDKEERSAQPKRAPTETPAVGRGRTVRVKMLPTSFRPREVKVPPGSKVIWENVSDVDHTVTADAGPSAAFDSRDLRPGARYSRRFTAQGTTSYICRTHYQMDGKVKVED